MKLSMTFIIPNYNGKEVLAANLPIVIAEAKKYDAAVIIYDDASTDDSEDFIRQQFPLIQIYSGKKNVGFAQAINTVVSYLSSEIIILLNHDVRPEPGFLDSLVPHFNDSTVFGVGCLEKNIEEDSIIYEGRGIGVFARGYLVHARGNVSSRTTLWVQGGSGAFRTKLWKELGGFDRLYAPFYYEDIDLSYRAQKAGYRLIFEPKSVVLHEHSKGAIRRHYSNFFIRLIGYRNQNIFFWKNISSPQLFRQYFFYLPYHLLKTIASLDVAYVIGLCYALFYLPSILVRRRQESRLWKLSDEEIVLNYHSEMGK